jgi:microcystin degradation protein MlrC
MIGMFYTTAPQMAAANAAARTLEEREGALSVSLIHGFLWADMAQMGAGALLVSDGLQPALEHELRRVAKAFFDARGETRALRKSVNEVLDIVAAAPPHAKPFVIADACDNAGGGAGSDSTFILDAVLARGLRGFAFGLLWDPVAVQFAQMAGEGGVLRLRLGGKTGPEAGRPLDVEAKVLDLRDNLSQHGIGFTAPIGAAAALEIEGNIVIINDVRGQVFSPTCFTDLGVDIAAQRAVVVKSTQHFYAQFEPLAQAVLYCETPGALALDIDPSRYRNLRRPIWPLDAVDYTP